MNRRERRSGLTGIATALAVFVLAGCAVREEVKLHGPQFNTQALHAGGIVIGGFIARPEWLTDSEQAEVNGALNVAVREAHPDTPVRSVAAVRTVLDDADMQALQSAYLSLGQPPRPALTRLAADPALPRYVLFVHVENNVIQRSRRETELNVRDARNTLVRDKQNKVVKEPGVAYSTARRVVALMEVYDLTDGQLVLQAKLSARDSITHTVRLKEAQREAAGYDADLAKAAFQFFWRATIGAQIEEIADQVSPGWSLRDDLFPAPPATRTLLRSIAEAAPNRLPIACDRLGFFKRLFNRRCE